MSKSLKYTFLVYAIFCLVVGIPLLLAPGKALGVLGWKPIDPLITRILGAALLGMGWASWKGFHFTSMKQAALLVEMNLIFAALSCVGLLRHLLKAWYPWYVWADLVILGIFGLLWVYHLVSGIRKGESAPD